MLHNSSEFVQLLTKKHVACLKRIEAARQATPRTGIVFLFCWRGLELVSQLRDDKHTAAPEPLYGGRTVAKKKKAAKKAGGAKKGAKKKKSTKKKSR